MKELIILSLPVLFLVGIFFYNLGRFHGFNKGYEKGKKYQGYANKLWYDTLCTFYKQTEKQRLN